MVTRWVACVILGCVACSPAAPLNESPRPGASQAAAASATASGSVAPMMVEVLPPADAVTFTWLKARGGEMTQADLRGRISVLTFVTSYDVPSQAQIRFLSRLARDHVPRLNAVVVVLEPAEHQPIVDAYASALDLGFPVAMADAATIRGEGPFAGLHHVPAVAILDREGRERYRHLGLVPAAQLEAAVRLVEQATGVEAPR